MKVSRVQTQSCSAGPWVADRGVLSMGVARLIKGGMKF
jgi:hypothetical protein